MNDPESTAPNILQVLGQAQIELNQDYEGVDRDALIGLRLLALKAQIDQATYIADTNQELLYAATSILLQEQLSPDLENAVAIWNQIEQVMEALKDE